jgi:hypothetical protein
LIKRGRVALNDRQMMQIKVWIDKDSQLTIKQLHQRIKEQSRTKIKRSTARKRYASP